MDLARLYAANTVSVPANGSASAEIVSASAPGDHFGVRCPCCSKTSLPEVVGERQVTELVIACACGFVINVTYSPNRERPGAARS